jgi:hypothetical protein
MKGALPWDKIFGKTLSQDLLLIYRLKKYMKPEVLFSNLPKETEELFVYCKKLDFEIKPDYNYMRSLLLKILNHINEKNDFKFSWTNRNGNDLLNRQDSKKFLKYSYKRKNSPHQRIYNLILNNQKSKDNILLNSTNLEKEMNKAKKDCQPVINISLSPEKENGSFQGEKMKQKINQISEIMIKYNTQNENDKENIVKKPINQNINNFVKKQIENNIIVKSQTENYLIKSQNEENNQKNYKKINQINKLRKNLIRNKHPKFIFKNDTFYDNNKNFLNPLFKNIIINDNKSFNLESNQYKDNQNKEDNILKINIINSCKNNLLTNSLFEDNSYSQKRHNKKNKNIIIDNNYLNNIKNDKKSMKAKTNYNKNSQKKLNQQIKRIIIKKSETNNFKNINTSLSNQFLNKYGTKNNSLIENKNILTLKNYNINSGSTNLINNKNINNNPQKNIRIINIISPIRKVETFNNNKNNIFSSKVNLYSQMNQNKFNSSNNNDIKNNKSLIKYNYATGIFTDNNNDLLIDDSKKIVNTSYRSPLKLNKSQINPFKRNQNVINRENNHFSNQKITSNSVNLTNLKGNNTNEEGTFLYISPKSIEKFK